MGRSNKSSDASRAERKAKKRKLEDSVPDLPGDEDVQASEETSNEAQPDHGGAITKKRKRNGTVEDGIVVEKDQGPQLKTNKFVKSTTDEVEREDGTSGEDLAATSVNLKDQSTGLERRQHTEAISTDDHPRKSKKERKAERKAKEAADKAQAKQAPEQLEHEDSPSQEVPAIDDKKPRKNNRNREKKRLAKANGEESKESRFIVFIGNLPFSATKESVAKHFAVVKPKSIRHLTQKGDPSKSKGIAFVEFDGYDRMKTCLKLLHHSNFDDGISPARKINVELTAGGGGNTKERREKIKEKNGKLNDERFRRIQEEEKAKWAKKNSSGEGDESKGIHPSRRGLLVGA